MVTTLAAVIAGAMIGLGLLLAVVAVFGRPSLPSRPWLERPHWVGDRLLMRTALAVVSSVVIWSATGWPAGGIVAGLGAAAAPSLVGGKARREAAVARIEAIAGWAEQLRDVMAAADGIQSAILTTSAVAPVPIRPEVRRLADRLAQHERLPVALGRFADEVANPLTDMIVTALSASPSTRRCLRTVRVNERSLSVTSSVDPPAQD